MPTLSDVSIVLVEPLYGGNLGSVARVMANFGLSRLVLVNPAAGILDDPKLEPMARTAADIARAARVCQTLQEALADAELAVGFSTRLGKLRRDGLELRPAVERLATDTPEARMAAVFGREDRGLTNDELDLCHWLVRIPTSPVLASLNLGQAVGLFCYEVSERRRRELPAGDARSVATVAELEGLYGQFERVLLQIGFIEEASPVRMMNHLRRIFSRRLPDPRDVRILRGILSKVEAAVGKGRTTAGEPR